ncbi:MAG: hypothetical protein IPP47_00330 [Bryobacterales bacterium]|nr:hypothetical protein [Bryobacterales bacterium]
MTTKALQKEFWQSAALVRIGLLLAVVFVFSACISLPFVNLDDPGYLGESSPVRLGFTASGLVYAVTSVRHIYWQPLTWLSYMADTELFGFSPMAIHRTNVVLHALAAMAVAALLARLVGSWWWGLLGALLWAAHPLRVESVAWAAERKDVLSGLLGVAALVAHLRQTDTGRRGWAAVALALGWLAMMAKPSAVVLPVLILLLDRWWEGAEWNWRRTTIHVSLLLLAALGVGALTVMGQDAAGALALVERAAGVRAANAVVSMATYLGQTVWPIGLACHYPYPAEMNPWVVAGSAAVLVALAGVCWRVRAGRPYLPYGLLFFSIALTPALGLVQAGRQAHADRFTYLAAVGLAWVVAAGGREASRRGERWGYGLALGLAVLGGALARRTQVQIETWRSTVALFQNAADAGGGDGFVMGNLGGALMMEGRNAEAVAPLRAAARLELRQAVHWRNLGWALVRTGDTAGAWAASERLVAEFPEDAEGHFLQGRAAVMRRAFPVAVAALGRAIRFGWPPGQAATLAHDAGVTLAREAIGGGAGLFAAAVEWAPERPEFRRSLGLVVVDLDRQDGRRAPVALR